MLSLTDVAWFVLYMVWFFNNDYQKQCQERVQAATEQNHQNKNTKHKPKDKKEEIKKDKKQQINLLQKWSQRNLEILTK